MHLRQHVPLASLFALSTIALSPWAGLAQDGPPPTPEARHEHFKAMRGKMLRTQVGLEDKRATQIEAGLAKFDAEHLSSMKQKHDAFKQTQALLDSKSTDEKAYRAAVAKQRQAFKHMHELREREWTYLASQLSPKEQALLLTSLDRMKHPHGKHGKGMGGQCGCPECCTHGAPPPRAAGGPGPRPQPRPVTPPPVQ